MPLQPRHPVVLAQQALSNQAVCQGRFTLGLGVSHHWIIKDMLGLPYERQATTMRCYLDVLDQALAGPGSGRGAQRALPHPPTARRHRHHADAGDDRRARPVMLKLAGERAAGTVLWLADERTIASHVVPQIIEGGRRRRAARPPG